MHRVAIVSGALFFAVAPIRAQETPVAETIVHLSPDKKFAVRIKYDPAGIDEENAKSGKIPRESTQAVDLVAMPSKEVVLKLVSEDGGLESKAAWSPDSKWFACAITLGPRVTETYVCHRVGEKFKEIKTEEMGVDPGGDTRNQYIHPVRWVKPGTLVLEQFTIFRGDGGDSTIQFTVRFDEKGKFHVTGKKKIRMNKEE